jgi:short-subunit dehydrogenase
MTDKFNGQVVVITGASSGIGEATAREFAKHGSKVVLAARSESKLARIVKEIKAANGEAFYIVTDVSVQEDCKRLIDETVSRYGKINILVNNAGVSMRAVFDDVDISVLHRLMDVNFWGTVYCTKYALPYLISSKGSVVGVSSIAGFHGLPGRTGYSASKFAMHGFLETLRIENLKRGLHVMIIAPGFTSTEIRLHALTAKGLEQGDSPRDEDTLRSPEYVARWILKGIRKKKRNKLLTWVGRLTALFQRIVPGFVDWAYYIEMSREPESPLK